MICPAQVGFHPEGLILRKHTPFILNLIVHLESRPNVAKPRGNDFFVKGAYEVISPDFGDAWTGQLHCF